MSHSHDRRIDVEALARVEGEGALHVLVKGDTVEDVRLRIYEPPRFFEGLLVGRPHLDPVDITARICGICPVAYQTSAALALEAACGVTVDPDSQIRALRRLLYCGEWIESHVLHVHLLHAPDFLGMPSVVEMAAAHRAEVERGLRLRKLGNDLLDVVGGRAVHPVNPRVGGFHRAPHKRDLLALRPRLEAAMEDAIDVVRWVATLDFPDLTTEAVLVSLRDDSRGGRYPIDLGTFVSSDGVDAPVSAFPDLVEEQQVQHSTALHARWLREDRPFLTGPLARFALNHDRLGSAAAAVASEVGLQAPERNPFRSIIVRSVEVVEAIAEALAIIDAYEEPDPSHIDVEPRPGGDGWGASEAPRGVLVHHYSLDDLGLVASATIVPPTSQNQAAIEADLLALVTGNLDLDDAALQWRCEQAIRNHDPCISCATHFLRLEVERS